MRSSCWLVLLLAAIAPAQKAPAPRASPWLTDYETARSRALDEQKSLLMIFVGPTDEGDNGRLEQQLVTDAEFAKTAGERYLLARFDYPKDASKIPEPLRQQQAELAVAAAQAKAAAEARERARAAKKKGGRGTP
jgi:hypothetical protein